MNRFPSVFVVCVFLLVAGCGGSSDSAAPNNAPEEAPVGLLSQVTDAAVFEASLKAALTTLSSEAQLAAADSAAGAESRGNYTGTYTQEVSVDEFDAVRYDGSHLFVAPRRYINCCFILEAASDDGATSTGNDPERSIRIPATDPDNGAAAPRSVAAARGARHCMIVTRLPTRRTSTVSIDSPSPPISTAWTAPTGNTSRACISSRFVTRTHRKPRHLIVSDRFNRGQTVHPERFILSAIALLSMTIPFTTCVTRMSGRRFGIHHPS